MDELRNTLEAAIAEHDVAPAAPVETPAIDVEVTSKTIEPATDSSTNSESAAPTPTAEKSVDKPRSIEEVANVDESDDDKPTPKLTGDPRIDRAPQSWKGDAKKLWTELPLSARQEVIRRERETAKVLQESAQVRQRDDMVKEAVMPHMGRIQQMYNGDPIAAIGNLMRVENTLVAGTSADKAKLVAGMIKKFGVDISALDNLLAGEEMPQQVQQQSSIEQLLEQRLAPMQQFLQRQQQQEAQQRQRVEQEAAQTVEQMASDPQFPYLNDVREEMADIIEINAKRGVYVSLQDAYEKAVRMNDTTYRASSSRDQSQSATQAALLAHQEAQKAKGAAVSVSGNPTGTSGNFSQPTDLRGAIEQAFGATGGRL